jgi:hypothetical protein
MATTRATMLLIANACSAAGQAVTTLNFQSDGDLETAIIKALKLIAKNVATGESAAIYANAQTQTTGLES